MVTAIILLLLVVGLQIYFAIKTLLEIVKMSRLFPDTDKISNEPPYSIEETDIQFESGNKQKLIQIDKLRNDISTKFVSIITATNHYLWSNSGTTAEYDIMRDIAERISESEENKIAASVSLPLYVGLMGTFGGVIFGIFYLLRGFSQPGAGVAASGISEVGVHDFLRGVLIAMIGSFFGLLLTTLNNSYFFKRAKSIRDDLKNTYFNFLQAQLLPTLENSLSHNIKEFKNHLQRFNTEFSDNIEDFSGTIPKITDNMRLQTEFIRRFNDINLPNLVNANLKIMDKLDQSVAIFDSFNQYAVNLQKSFEASDRMLDKVTGLLDRLGKFEENINGVGELVQQSYQNYGMLGSSVAGHLTELQKRWQLVQEFMNKSDNEVRDVALSYSKEFQGLTQKLQQELSDTFSVSKDENPLNKLKLLDAVNKNLETISRKLDKNTSSAPDYNHEISEGFRDMVHELRKLRRTITPSIFRPKEFFYFIISKNGQSIER